MLTWRNVAIRDVATTPVGMAALLMLISMVLYSITCAPTVTLIDSGEIVSALHEPGILHPPGAPLYTIVGFVVSLIPFGEVALRLNVLSSVFAALGVGMMFLLCYRLNAYRHWDHLRALEGILSARQKSIHPPRHTDGTQATEPASSKVGSSFNTLAVPMLCALLLASSSTFWGRALVAKMYSLHYLFVMAILLASLEYRWAWERGDSRRRRYLILVAFLSGLSLTNHMMTVLVVPAVAAFLLIGRDTKERARFVARHLLVCLVAFAVPLLLYLYLPLRSAQGPTMNWGTPHTWSDFWRHISAWQYKQYLHNSFAGDLTRLFNYASQQWLWAGVILLPLFMLGALFMALVHQVLFIPLGVAFVTHIYFCLQYGITEIEPYVVPIYIIALLWLGIALDSMARNSYTGSRLSVGDKLTLALLLLAVGVIPFQYARQNRGSDRRAELFALNILHNLAPNAIIITDHWDFQSASYYLQLVRNERADVVVIDKSLLRYPWYLEQLEKRYPWLIESSRNEARAFQAEQRKWVEGEPFDGQVLQRRYIDLLTSFIEKNLMTHPGYIFLLSQCLLQDTPSSDEGSAIAPRLRRVPDGLPYRLRAPDDLTPAPSVSFDLRGYTTERLAGDEFHRFNAQCYAKAYRRAAKAQPNVDRGRWQELEVAAWNLEAWR